MRIKKKLRGNGGFTLAETLLAVLILLLVSSIVATGMPAAKNAYEKIIVAANAQVLLSTGATALRDELGTAWEVKVDGEDDTIVTYNSSDTGAKSKLYIDKTDKKIHIQEYMENDYLNLAGGKGVGDERLLVSDKAANEDLVLTYTNLKENATDKTIVIYDLVVKNKDDKEMASLGSDLTIPVISFAS